MEPTAFDKEYLPSTLEHRPLHVPEKVMLKRYFECDGQDDLDAFPHWEKADAPALQLLEAWVWGMRYWGRETIFRLALAGYRLCKSRWQEGDAGAGLDTNVKTVKMGGDGATMAVVTEACLRWAKLPGEAIAQEIEGLRGETPELWLAREVPEEDRESVFAWTLIANDRMAATILLHRDAAVQQAAQAIVCGAKALLATGHDLDAAVRKTREFVVLDLRQWMGRKW